MNTLETLRALNPTLPLYSVTDPEFAPYGRVIQVPDGETLIQRLSVTPVPETGNAYTGSDPDLEDTEAVSCCVKTVFGGMDVQAGFCNGHGHTLNALEYHKCPEVNASSSGLVLLLALPGDLKEGRISSDAVVGFYLPKGVFVEIHPLVLHYAPCRIAAEPFRALVVLTRHTNEALPALDPDAEGEAKYLWMSNKWLLCHPDSPEAGKGAVQGIDGENIELRIPE